MAKTTHKARADNLDELMAIWEDPDASLDDKMLRTFRELRETDPQGAVRLLAELEKETKK
jgi:hypothetical protein